MTLSDVRALLAGHRPHGRDAERALAEAVALLATPAPFHRGQTEPGHFTASAIVLAPDFESVLLIHHLAFEIWIQPGGHFEPGDATVERAARREVLEETGLAALDLVAGAPLLLDVDVHAIPANPRRGEEAHRHFDLRLLFRARERALRPSSEVAGARWVPVDALAGLATDASVRRAVARARAWARETP
jgi:8-oxo-dGTP pyrophosphatase MutT (NUDIX family)